MNDSSPSSRKNEVRPNLRVAGTLLLAVCAALFVQQAFQVFGHQGALVQSCPPRKGQWLCLVGAAMLSAIPPQAHGPILGVACLTTALLLTILAWHLFKPLLHQP
jgi:hypothetical protein